MKVLGVSVLALCLVVAVAAAAAHAAAAAATAGYPSLKLTLEQRNSLVMRFVERFGDRLPKTTLAQLSGMVATTDPDLVKNRLLHSWAENNITCKKVDTCMVLQPEICATVCEAGSVQPDPWTAYALKTQREIQVDVPLNFATMPGTHNSAITLANGYGLSEGILNFLTHLIDSDWQVYIANQQLDLWDQFNLGIRHFEIDIHWWAGDIRICHAGGVQIELLDELIHWIADEFGIVIEWDSETIGCFSPYDRPFNRTLREIRQFMFAPENKNEFAIFYFDNQPSLQEWGKVPTILEEIVSNFGSAVFTPVEKESLYPNSWPTLRQLNQLGKKMMFVSRTDYKDAMSKILFARDALWKEYGPFPFYPYPNCTISNGDRVGNGDISRVLGDSLAYGPFWTGYDGQIMLPEDVLVESQCNPNYICVDQLSPPLAKGFVWSWDIDQPKALGSCTIMQPNGRWATLDCSTKLFSACFDPKTGAFALSITATAWGNAVSCPEGYLFGRPVNGLENSKLHAALQSLGSSSVWLNHKATP